MLDVVLAISVLTAVLFFGALLAVGNERQRKAIDGIREETAHWAEQDLRLKRARIAREITVPDARIWLTGIVSRLLGIDDLPLNLKLWEKDGLKALVAPLENGGKWVVTPTLPASFIKRTGIQSQTKLSKMELSILGNHPGRIPVYEMNIVTCGPFFDLEAKLAWSMVTGSPLEIERLYLFVVPPVKTGK
jgi:hypothetical protein